MKIKLKGTDAERITTALRYAITKIKGNVANREVDKFQQLLDRFLAVKIEREEPVDYNKVGEVYGSSKKDCINCDE